MVRYAIDKRHMHACRSSFLKGLIEWGRGMEKRDITSNINFFMNVPVTPEGKLTFEDGISDPGKYVEMRAEADVLAAISNCPQLNNPCNAYDPHRCRYSSESGGELMFRKVLIANRGAIACRIIRTLRRMSVASVAVYSTADRHSLHVRAADEAVEIGPAAAAQSYLSVEALLDAAMRTGAEAIHPGYGFLSESAGFAEACAARGIVFIGPTPAHLRDFGLHGARHARRAPCRTARYRVLPRWTKLRTGAGHRHPVMLKSTAGGSGIGMRLCRGETELRPLSK
jgi:hypothetical protein